MKKLVFTMIAALLAITLNAQISVWDGSYEPFDTIHAGTADDPILIENAAQLAYMSQLFYCGHPAKYWKLTTDVDLDNRDWTPIGDIPYITCPEFDGYFDGDNHTVYHLTNALFFDTYEGYIKNITVKDSEYYSEYDMCFGMIVYHAPLIENCHNYGNITVTDNWMHSLKIGGIAGQCHTMINCSNHGTITVNADWMSYCYAGGLSGTVTNIETSFNDGSININVDTSDKCKIGGVCGMVFNTALNCYNTANINVGNENFFVGGIAGDITSNANQYSDTININNCYNAGNISASNAGGILANADYANVVINADNSFYINTMESINNYGSPKSSSEMQSQDFVNLLNNVANIYAMDDMHVNHGYPIFAKYYSADETMLEDGISIYPNPAKDVISIQFDGNATCNSIEIYSLDGRLLKSQNYNFSTIDISSLITGVYLLKVRMFNGITITERLIKE